MKMTLAPLALLAAASAAAQTPNTDDEKALYAVGFNMGTNVKQGLGPSKEEVQRIADGLADGLAGKKAAFDMEAFNPQAKLGELRQKRQAKLAEGEKAKGKEFADAQGKTAGAQVTPTGLVYLELRPGDGAQPKPSDRVKVNYRGTLIDGTEFDSSYKRNQPAEFPLGGVIKCWTEGVGKMKVGGKAKLVCPSDIAYGDSGRPPQIPGGATLVFEVELLDIVVPPAPGPAPALGAKLGPADAGASSGKGMGCTAAPGAFAALAVLGVLALARRKAGRWAAGFLGALAIAAALPARAQAPSTDEDKDFYAIGYNMGQNVASSFAPSKTEADLVKKGLVDGCLGNKAAFDMEAFNPQAKIRPLAMKRHQAIVEAEKAKGKEYAAKTAKQKGVKAEADGLVFIQEKAGSGESPKATDRVKVNYRGTLINGTEFDSSYKRNQPAEFGLNGVIKCWTEGVQKMKPGGKAKLVCPSDIAYGDNGQQPKIPGGATLVFEIELLSVSAAPPSPMPMGVPPQMPPGQMPRMQLPPPPPPGGTPPPPAPH